MSIETCRICKAQGDGGAGCFTSDEDVCADCYRKEKKRAPGKLTVAQIIALQNISLNGLPHRASQVVRFLKNEGYITPRDAWPDPDQRYDLTDKGRAALEIALEAT